MEDREVVERRRRMRHQSLFVKVEVEIVKTSKKVKMVVVEGRENEKVRMRKGKRFSHHEIADTSGGGSPIQHEHSL